VSRFGECPCQRCAVRRVAGDVAARLLALPHADFTEVVIWREMPSAVFLDGAVPGPRIERLNVGDPLRMYVRGCISDIGALELVGDQLRYCAADLVAIAKHLTTRVEAAA
jgi:hypothetical protein